jgi:DNA-binding XRE family transcriptional regulator
MIRTNSEYEDACLRLREDQRFLEEQRAALVSLGLTDEEVERAMEPAVSFHEQLREEVDSYERIKRRDFGVIRSLTQIGRLLIGLRIAGNITQAELARRLDVNESVVSRDERNEYHGISVERAQRIIDALQGTVTVAVQPHETEELLAAAV